MEAHRRIRHLRSVSGQRANSVQRQKTSGEITEEETEDIVEQDQEKDEDFIKYGEKIITPDDSVSLALQFRSQSPGCSEDDPKNPNS